MPAVTQPMIERVAARLAEGGWSYTARQLYYAVCAEAETTTQRQPPVNGATGMGLILILVAFILIRFPIVFVAVLALGMSFVVLGLVQRLRPMPPPRGRVLPFSVADFEERARGLSPAALINAAQGAPSAGDAVNMRYIVSDTGDTAGIVNANVAEAGLDGVRAVTGDDAALAANAAMKPRDVIALHDASPRGCALAVELAQSGFSVVDAGLRPKWLHDDEHQAVEGAPARLPRDLTSVLSDDEIAWLLSGRRVELASLAPAQILGLVSAALATAPPQSNVVRELALDAAGLAPLVAAHPRGGR